MPKRIVVVLASVLVFIALGLSAEAGYASTKIAPTEAEPGHPFTIIDTPAGRLVDGSIAIFTPSSGAPVEVALRTHKPYKTAQGQLPAGMFGGDYQVVVALPDGSAIVVGSFHVIGPPPSPPSGPSIDPVSGPIGTSFTITDPEGRIQLGDLAVFYLDGTNPGLGTLADNVSVSADGTTLTGNVPNTLATGAQYLVGVTPALGSPLRFGPLAFFIE